MKDQVFMSPNNGQLVVGIPLVRVHHEESLGSLSGYTVTLTAEKPLAYIMDADHLMEPQVLSAEWIENKMINLGDL